MGRRPIVIQSTTLNTQARDVITTSINLLEEIILNSSDAQFGKKFTEFINIYGDCSVDPYYPTLADLDKWNDQINTSPNKCGTISLTFESDHCIIFDDGPGIKCEYINKRMESYGRSEDDQISLKNGLDINRRGQFSRGLKEVIIALNEHLTPRNNNGDGIIKIETAFQNPSLELRYWEGHYEYEGGNAYFDNTIACIPAPPDIQDTFTKVVVKYPTGNHLIHSNTIERSIRNNLKFQKILSDHKVVVNYRGQSTGSRPQKIVITQYIDSVPHTEIYNENFRIQIPSTEEFQEIENVLDIDFIEMKIVIYKIDTDEPLTKYTARSLTDPKSYTRGIYIGDHTTEYAILPIDNNAGTEYLQAKIIVPTMRVFSVLGTMHESTLPSLVHSNRKTIDVNHPLLKILMPKIYEIWNEIVTREREEMERARGQVRDRRTRVMNTELENTLDRIIRSELDDDPIDPIGPIIGPVDSPGPRLPSDPQPPTIFGSQLSSYGRNISIHPGKERKINIYVHKDLFTSRAKYIELKIEKGIAMISNDSMDMYSDVYNFPLIRSQEVKDTDLVKFSLIIYPPVDIDPPGEFILNIKIQLDDIGPLIADHLNAGNDILSLEPLYPKYKIPENVEYSNGYLISTSVLQLKNFDKKSGFLKITWEENEEFQIDRDRRVRQRDWDQGWFVEPTSYMDDNGNMKSSFHARMLCRSNFFANQFDPNVEIIDQSESFKSLMGVSVCGVLAQILTPRKVEDPEQHLDEMVKYMTQYMPVVMKTITDERYQRTINR